jgi:cytochrome c nitrite reductase small subunit
MKDGRGSQKSLLILAGLLLGVLVYGGFAFSMKATDQARFCGNCHSMHEFVRTHQMSGHAKQSCNECHLPAGGIGRYVYKAKSGTGDVMITAFGTLADVIHATEDTRVVVNDNCKRCHAMTIINVAMDAKPFCTDCHRNTPHMSKMPISNRSAANE